MKNKEKYDNHDDALNAFYEMCYSRSCSGCPYYTAAGNSHHCVVAWLYDEAKGNDSNIDKEDKNG